MKNKTVKKAFTAICAMALLIGITACGNGEKSSGSSELTGYYASGTNVEFMSAYPEHTFKQATFGVQNIETFADNTYCLTSTETFYSGALEFADDGKYDVVPRGANITKYYGTLTSTDEGGLITLELSKPTAVIANSSYSAGANPIGYVNTKAWTDEMGTAVGGEGPALTAEEYLETVAFPEASIIVDGAKASFDYTVLTSGETAN
ncbi:MULTISPECIES: hypothetical protein [Paenibacillus]|uniref:hypothetical protein n=1 Tax=Paenibacillus TaxID=44249 RepID=UPI0004F78765|nr:MULTISPECIES: hypothetical protein [unclassified Paenibacillus]AIQ31387.1 hypothetical protein P40081_26900 [Paenibacillus sp. FSL P4-0081]OMF28209.1 hypothetical protein BK132_14130 [Paenibacillus sp. FSL H8-0259]